MNELNVCPGRLAVVVNAAHRFPMAPADETERQEQLSAVYRDFWDQVYDLGKDVGAEFTVAEVAKGVKGTRRLIIGVVCTPAAAEAVAKLINELPGVVLVKYDAGNGPIQLTSPASA